MRQFELVIVGGGLASARAIKAYREAGGEGTVALLSNDAVLPYHRPPLSKGYLRDETDEAPFVEDEAFYADNDVDVLLGTLVSAVTPRARWLTTQRGRRYGYEQLLIATGARPRRLNVPGAELDGVFTLRSPAWWSTSSQPCSSRTTSSSTAAVATTATTSTAPTPLWPKVSHYLDVGTSGGIHGLERGFCLMIGGEPEPVRRLDPIFASDYAQETAATGVSHPAPTHSDAA